MTVDVCSVTETVCTIHVDVFFFFGCVPSKTLCTNYYDHKNLIFQMLNQSYF